MPKPPNPTFFDKVNFITNYALLGCTPPFFLFIECAQEPAQDLLLLLIAPDLEDIGQAIFEPKKGRRRNPGRHGRKKGRGLKFPDTSEMIGQRVRGIINPGDVIRLSPLRYLFPLLNIYEGINFFAAVMEGVTDVFFEGILGVISIDRNNCKDLGRFVREIGEPLLAGGAGAPFFPVEHRIPIAERDFPNSQIIAFNRNKDSTVHLAMTLRPTSPVAGAEVCLALATTDGRIRYQSRTHRFAGTESVTLDVTGDFRKGETFSWGLGPRNGFFLCTSGRVFGYTLAELPWA